MEPSARQVHVDRILTNISVAFAQSQENYIATKVFPIVPVEKQSDIFYTYPKEAWLRDEAAKRADGDESAGSGYGIGQDSYSCEVYAIHKDVTDRVIKNADVPLNPVEDATKFVTGKILLRREIQWVDDFFKTTVWGTDVTGVASGPTAGQFLKWSDVNSDPIEDVETGKEAILSKTGYEANTLVLGYKVFRYLKNHPDIIDRIKYTSSQTVTADLLARLFEVERVLVAKAIKNSAKQGQTGSYGFTHGAHALLCYSAPNPGLLTPSAGYTFAWKGVSDGMGETIGTSRFRMQARKSDRIESEAAWVNKKIAGELGYFFSAAA